MCRTSKQQLMELKIPIKKFEVSSSYDADHHVAVLTAILDYLNKRLVLQLVSNLTGNNTNVPRNPSFGKPISLRFPVLLWQELHGPVLCDEN